MTMKKFDDWCRFEVFIFKIHTVKQNACGLMSSHVGSHVTCTSTSNIHNEVISSVNAR